MSVFRVSPSHSMSIPIAFAIPSWRWQPSIAAARSVSKRVGYFLVIVCLVCSLTSPQSSRAADDPKKPAADEPKKPATDEPKKPATAIKIGQNRDTEADGELPKY